MACTEPITACHTLHLHLLRLTAVSGMLDGSLLGNLYLLSCKAAVRRSWRGAPQTFPVQRLSPLQPQVTSFCAFRGRRLPRWGSGRCACWCATRAASLQTSSCGPPRPSQAASAARCVSSPCSQYFDVYSRATLSCQAARQLPAVHVTRQRPILHDACSLCGFSWLNPIPSKRASS